MPNAGKLTIGDGGVIIDHLVLLLTSLETHPPTPYKIKAPCINVIINHGRHLWLRYSINVDLQVKIFNAVSMPH